MNFFSRNCKIYDAIWEWALSLTFFWTFNNCHPAHYIRDKNRLNNSIVKSRSLFWKKIIQFYQYSQFEVLAGHKRELMCVFWILDLKIQPPSSTFLHWWQLSDLDQSHYGSIYAILYIYTVIIYLWGRTWQYGYDCTKP